jgi:hypothetical protein
MDSFIEELFSRILATVFLQILEEAKKLFQVIGGMIRFSFPRGCRRGQVDAVVEVGKSMDVRNHLALRSSYCRINLENFFFR